MKNPFQLHGGHGLCASRFHTVPSRESHPDARPRVVIAAVGKRLERELAAHFTKLGWRVKHAVDAVQARRLAQCGRADAVVIPADSPGESGYLACAKLARSAQTVDETAIRVVLVGPAGAENEQYASFAGAAGYVTPDTPAAEVAELLAGEFAQLAN